MKKYSWLFAILGVGALGMALMLAAAFGAGVTYFFLQADPVQAAFAAPADIDNEEGVLISDVKPESAAAEVGLVRGDIVLKINAEPVNNVIKMKAILGALEPGDVVELTVLHGDDIRTLSVKLDDAKGFAVLGVGTCDFPMGNKGFPGGSMGDVIIEAFPAGAEILEVVPGSPADAAGLQVGDLILSVDEKEVGFEAELADLIQQYEPGDEVTLWVLKVDAKNEESATLNKSEIAVILSEHPEKPGRAYLGVTYQLGAPLGFEDGEFPFMELLPLDELPEGWDEDGEFYFHGDPGMPFEGEEGMPHFFDLGELPEGMDGAVIISEVLEDTPAAEADLRPGDLIVAVDGEPVVEIEAFVETLQSRKPGDEVTLTIIREGEGTEVTVTLTEHPDDPEKGFLGVLAGSLAIMEEFELPENFEHDFEFELPGVPGGDA